MSKTTSKILIASGVIPAVVAFFLSNFSIFAFLACGLFGMVIAFICIFFIPIGIDEIKTGSKKQAIIFLLIFLLVILLLLYLMYFCMFCFDGFDISSSSHKCTICGKIAGNYSNGACYSCYKDAKNAVINSYYKY